MTSVNIAELKNRLSNYLNRVKAGEEILIRDREEPIAKIVPIKSDDYNDERARLASDGRVRLGSGEALGESFWKMPRPRVSANAIRRVIDEDRSED